VSNHPVYDDKLETQKQWGQDPCGAVTAGEVAPGTAEFYRRVEDERYGTYAPWMRETMGFARHTGKRVLEIGPGLGTDHAQFARAGAEMYAVDLTAAHLKHTRRRFDLEGLLTRPVRGDAEALPLAGASFDVVYSFGVLHHTPDTAGAVREIHRVSRPGGLARVMLYHRGSLGYWGQVIIRHGILRGELLRGNSPVEIMGKYVEFNEGGGNPLVKVYSRGEARELFSMFSEVKIQVEQLTRPELYFLGRIIPEVIFRRLARSIGWNVIISARK